MHEFHFIAGLPRSGSTLLAAMLRQNPKFHASMSSPVGSIFKAMQNAVSRGHESAMFLTDEQRERLLRSCFDECYRGYPEEVIFDNNRVWTSKMAVLAKLYPDCTMLCCVRDPVWIVDSIERLTRKNPLELSGIFGFNAGGTVYDRVRKLLADDGMVGFALNGLKEALYGEENARIMVVDYDTLTMFPEVTLKAIYEFVGHKWYPHHDFDNLEQIPLAGEFDERIGTPGLHTIGHSVKMNKRPTILPPDIVNNIAKPFWSVKA